MTAPVPYWGCVPSKALLWPVIAIAAVRRIDGARDAELLHAATVAVAARVPVDRLWHAVPCFPTMSEVGCACWRLIETEARAIGWFGKVAADEIASA